MQKLCILGTEYTIFIKKYDEDKAFALRSISGYCDGTTKQIVVCDMSTYKDWEHEPPERASATQRQILRHEIVHAFYHESGLADNSLTYDGPWPNNEEMVDWFALQGPKIYAAWREADALDKVEMREITDKYGNPTGVFEPVIVGGGGYQESAS